MKKLLLTLFSASILFACFKDKEPELTVANRFANETPKVSLETAHALACEGAAGTLTRGVVI